MSADSVDDIHAAEDFAGAAVACLVKLRNLIVALPTETVGARACVSEALALIASWESYCRPTCQADGDPDFEDCDEGEYCGCPCGHTRQDEEAPM